MKKILLFTGFIATLLLASCESHTDINIISPVEGQSVNLGQMVNVKAKLSDSDALSGESLTVLSETGDTIYHYSDLDFQGQSHTLIQSFQATTQGHCKVTIGANGGSGPKYKSVTIIVE